MTFLLVVSGVVAYFIIGWLVLLVSVMTFDDDWLDGLSDFNGDFDPVMVGLVIMFWPMLAVILPIAVFSKCIVWSLNTIKARRLRGG